MDITNYLIVKEKPSYFSDNRQNLFVQSYYNKINKQEEIQL